MTAVNSYDALKVLAYAIENAGDDAEAVKSFLKGLKEFPGASGTFSFDNNGDVNKEIMMKKVKDGKFVYID